MDWIIVGRPGLGVPCSLWCCLYCRRGGSQCCSLYWSQIKAPSSKQRPRIFRVSSATEALLFASAKNTHSFKHANVFQHKGVYAAAGLYSHTHRGHTTHRTHNANNMHTQHPQQKPVWDNFLSFKPVCWLGPFLETHVGGPHREVQTAKGTDCNRRTPFDTQTH